MTPPERGEGRQILRFDAYHRITHVGMMISFLGLAFTGAPLLFHESGWAKFLARALGGFAAAGIFHRTFALLLIGVFALHVGRLLQRLFVRKEYGILWGPESMVPQPRDLFELVAHVRWFFRRGERPRFDHFTYWEKFDYWAVFWGMFIIGGSGLMLWFPQLFSHLVPGWVYNVALLVHGEEALLAVVFIVTIHFFNGHLRPEKFPMDTVIFTGRVDEDELRHERPALYDRLKASKSLDVWVVPAAPGWVLRAGRTVGTIAVILGLSLLMLIVYALGRH